MQTSLPSLAVTLHKHNLQSNHWTLKQFQTWRHCVSLPPTQKMEKEDSQQQVSCHHALYSGHALHSRSGLLYVMTNLMVTVTVTKSTKIKTWTASPLIHSSCAFSHWRCEPSNSAGALKGSPQTCTGTRKKESRRGTFKPTKYGFQNLNLNTVC